MLPSADAVWSADCTSFTFSNGSHEEAPGYGDDDDAIHVLGTTAAPACERGTDGCNCVAIGGERKCFNGLVCNSFNHCVQSKDGASQGALLAVVLVALLLIASAGVAFVVWKRRKSAATAKQGGAFFELDNTLISSDDDDNF